ncbi:anthranilate synthase component I family protein [Candidatus Nitrosotenuis sp. DW1]|uniref:anthranilate synthase component I family protein n=1 Tax=Candidatus Nitrosotenuis sp. DW1 TaxID=2259672 RepID=UPI0015C84A38|nr:anthranilate synthase component I family protein [Candidatus Nitrosotenuis sp. DW1]QLH09960.1 anthranilate synthase component I [Candidatus Nitrosotenuis sp. DW1]
MAFFGNSSPTIIPLEISGSQFEIYSKIEKNYSHTFLFESLTGPEELAETSLIGFDPDVVLQGYEDRIVLQYRDGSTKTITTTDPIAEIKNLIGHTDDTSFRYLGGAVGIINYDAIKLYEKIPIRSNRAPLMEFGIYQDGILYDNKTRKLLYFYYDKNRINDIKLSEPNFGKLEISDISVNMDEKKFSEIVSKAKKYIHDGDIFQVVLSRRFNFGIKGNHLRVYKELRSLNPSPYLYHMKFGHKTFIGSSPEMLVRVTGSEVETFPIAGTRKITEDEGKNEMLKQELLNDEKEIAEHTMLVDLGRNDIGRVCKYGSVHVTELMQVKRFSHVQHIVSHVVGTLDSKHDMFTAFEAVFPAGTVTGAPKVRAMEIINELEADVRGQYAGAVGYFSNNGCCDFAIAIRSIFIDGESGFAQSGAGIVADSTPENEFKETEHKVGAMLAALKEATR